MNKRIYVLLLALSILLSCLAGCNQTPAATEPDGTGASQATEGTGAAVDAVDYATAVTLDMDSDTLKQEVTVKSYIDGDTTHFFVPTDVVDTGILKARYLAVNTPESTGKIEEWGKKAASFTREKLEGADSIIIESDNGTWNLDSTGDRHLVWVWYRPAGTDTYRNLNIELLQNGLSVASNSAENRYGDTCMAAIGQAKQQQLYMHSKKDDPDFYYGAAIPVTLKGLRTNIELYGDKKVAFEGVISMKDDQTIYVEEYDAETDMYYGISVYLSYMTGTGLEILSPGNRVMIVGTATYYETGGTWQISGIQYVEMRPNDPNNVQLISEGHEAAYRPTTAQQLNEGEVVAEIMADLETDITSMKSFPYAQMALCTSVSMENLQVQSIYTTTNEVASKGAMTLTCMVDGEYIDVRTAVLRDADGNLITADAYQGKTINVKGIVDFFSDSYQIKVFSPDDITIVG